MINNVMPKVFAWMFIGLLVTFGTGYFISLNPTMLYNIFGSAFLWVILIAELVLVIVLSARIKKMNPTTAKVCFLLYSFVSGLTFASIFITYQMSSIMYSFLISSAIFGLFAFFGSKTKMDLTKFGTYLLMALIGILICVIVNLFVNSGTFDLVLSALIVIIFVGFTAYDVQRIQKLGALNMIPEDNLAIYGALELYLDFINIFIEILNLFGRNDN